MKDSTGIPSQPIKRSTPPPSRPSKVRGYLMIGLLAATVVLVPLVGIRLYKILHKTTPEKIDVASEWQAAFNAAKEANKEIFNAEGKVWMKGEKLLAGDFDLFRNQLKVLQDSAVKLQDLLELIRDKVKGEAQETREIIPHWLQVKLWIVDVEDLIEKEKNPPEYGGLYIPMYCAMDRWHKAQKGLQELSAAKADILKRNSPAEKQEARERIKQLSDICVATSKTFSDLDDYIKGKRGLARDDLTPELIPELGFLRDEGALAGQAVKLSRDLRYELGD